MWPFVPGMLSTTAGVVGVILRVESIGRATMSEALSVLCPVVAVVVLLFFFGRGSMELSIGFGRELTTPTAGAIKTL
jgi:hypothetical protein